MKLNNCPSCNAKEDKLHIHDCGYNTFNAGHVECKSCGLKIDFNCIDNGDEGYIFAWNKLMSQIDTVLNYSKKDLTTFILDTIESNSTILSDLERKKEKLVLCTECVGNGTVYVLVDGNKVKHTCSKCNGIGMRSRN